MLYLDHLVLLLQDVETVQLGAQVLVGGLECEVFVEVHSIVALQRVVGNLQMPLELQSLLRNLNIEPLVL